MAMKISARNALTGTIKTLKEGPVMTEVIVAVSGGTEVAAVITKDSAANLELSEGKSVYAVIKATDIMIMTDS
jgi:molybdopterin-binding protein